jgi:hypothetical protein
MLPTDPETVAALHAQNAGLRAALATAQADAARLRGAAQAAIAESDENYDKAARDGETDAYCSMLPELRAAPTTAPSHGAVRGAALLALVEAVWCEVTDHPGTVPGGIATAYARLVRL